MVSEMRRHRSKPSGNNHRFCGNGDVLTEVKSGRNESHDDHDHTSHGAEPAWNVSPNIPDATVRGCFSNRHASSIDCSFGVINDKPDHHRDCKVSDENESARRHVLEERQVRKQLPWQQAALRCTHG